MSVLLFAVIVAQGAPKRPVHPGRPLGEIADTRPVTAREVRESFDRVSGLYKKVNDKSWGTTAVPAADRAATRTEIVAEMARIYKAAASSIRFTPAASKFDPAKFRIDASVKPSLSKLVSLGYVAPIGPLAVGPQPGLTTKEFGDALGFFVARLSQTTHLPSSKWTPMLQGD